MEAIRIKIIRLASLNGLVAALTAKLIFKKLNSGTISMSRALVVTVFVLLILLVLLIREYVKYKDAKLIKENEIMHIQFAEIEYEGFEESKRNVSIDGIDVFISCFGVMLGSRVIKFNMDGIALKNIKISPEYISFVYGANGKDKALKVLHGAIDKQEIQEFAKRISYETGVNPLVTD